MKNQPTFLSFPSISSFHNVIKTCDAYIADHPDAKFEPTKYRGKIKCHGTNAGVRIDNGEIVAQSRTQLITPENDNAGFARWVASKTEFFKAVGKQPISTYERDPNSTAYIIAHRGAVPDRLPEYNFTVFGEWCGFGIMKGAAINKISTRVFAIFAIMIGDTLETANMVTDPAKIAELLGPLPEDIHILPWEGDEFTVDFSNRQQLQEVADKLNKVITDIEPCDPWVKATFGVEGIAEGIVYVPGAGDLVSRNDYSNRAFKAKGDEHKVVKAKEAVQVDPNVAANTDEFVTMFVTEPRLEQGLTAVGGNADVRKMGDFLKWMSSDILKESKDELESSKLTWQSVQKPIQNLCKSWFLSKAKVILS